MGNFIKLDFVKTEKLINFKSLESLLIRVTFNVYLKKSLISFN
jgi:hypothetical protein